MPNPPLLLLVTPSFWVVAQRGEGGIGIIQESLPAIAFDSLIQDRVQWLALTARQFPQNGEGVLVDTDTSATHR